MYEGILSLDKTIKIIDQFVNSAQMNMIPFKGGEYKKQVKLHEGAPVLDENNQPIEIDTWQIGVILRDESLEVNRGKIKGWILWGQPDDEDNTQLIPHSDEELIIDLNKIIDIANFKIKQEDIDNISFAEINLAMSLVQLLCLGSHNTMNQKYLGRKIIIEEAKEKEKIESAKREFADFNAKV